MYMNPISSLLQPDNLFVEFSFSFSFDEKKLYDQISFKIHENIIMRPSLKNCQLGVTSVEKKQQKGREFLFFKELFQIFCECS